VKKKFLWPVLLIVVFVLSRWPGLMPQNFSATYAIVFCAGLYLTGWLGWVIPLAVLAASDLLITLFFYSHGSFSPGEFIINQAPNYLIYAGLIALGRSFKSSKSWWTLTGGGILGALLFYIVTNTGAWMTLPYAKNLAGWIQALTRGLPGYPPTWEFFRNTLLSGGMFTGLFVGAMKLSAESKTSKEKKKEEDEDEEEEPAGEKSEPEHAKS
jgi:hypothetical protein